VKVIASACFVTEDLLKDGGKFHGHHSASSLLSGANFSFLWHLQYYLLPLRRTSGKVRVHSIM
jgi:hypothetical protein